MDLVLQTSSGKSVAIEIKRTLSPKLSPGFIESMKTLQASGGYFIMPEGESFPLSETVTAMSLPEFLQQALRT